jgi:hypothetical protein
LQAEKQSGRNKQGWGLASGHKSVGLVSVLASRHSAHPKNVKDLTFQAFVGIMGTNQSGYFVLSGDVVKGGVFVGISKFVRSPGAEADGLSQASSLQIRPVVRRRL